MIPAGAPLVKMSHIDLVTDDIAQFSALSIAQEWAKGVHTAAGIRNPNPSLLFFIIVAVISQVHYSWLCG